MMATEVRKMLARRGADPRDFTLVPFGGAGPTHAALLAEEAGIARMLVPLGPGTFCAFGAVVADLRRDFVRSLRLALGDGSDGTARLADALAELAADASAWIGPLAHMAGAVRYDVSAELRYPGQAFDLPVTLRAVDPVEDQAGPLAAAFHAAHQRLYGFAEPASPVQVARIALTVAGTSPRTRTMAAGTGHAIPVGRRRALLPGDGWHDLPVFRRADLGAGAEVEGPLLVDQPDTTVLLTPGWRMRCLEDGNLLATRGTR
jgi:N-methylhydantoinase A